MQAGLEAGLGGFTMKGVLSGIHYYRCHDYIELVALVNLLPDIVSQHPKVRVYARNILIKL